MVDGASYAWSVWINRDAMKANFNGSRYNGSFDLKRVPSAAVAREIPLSASDAVARTAPAP